VFFVSSFVDLLRFNDCAGIYRRSTEEVCLSKTAQEEVEITKEEDALHELNKWKRTIKNRR